MLGPADPGTARRAEAGPREGFGARTVLHVPNDPGVDPATLGVARPIGLEGTGRVVAAGPGPEAQALLDRMVSLMGAGTYARYVRARARDAVPLSQETTAAQGATSARCCSGCAWPRASPW